MQLLQNGTQGPTTIPTKQTAVGTPGYGYGGPPGSTPASRWDPDVANTILAELIAFLTAAGIGLDPTNNAQILAATKILFGQLAVANTWAGAQTLDQGAVLPNNVTIRGKDTGGTQRALIGIGGANIVTIDSGAQGAATGGSLAVAGALSSASAAITGAITAAVGTGYSHEVLFFASGSWTVPTGVTEFQVLVWGAGGGSGGAASSTGAGGNGGGFATKTVSTTPGTVYGITIGAGGSAGAGSPVGATGGTGGTTSFGSIITCTGGPGGGGGSAGGIPNPTGGQAFGGDVNFNGNIGAAGSSPTGASGGGGGSAVFGGPGGMPSVGNGTDGLFPGGGAGGGGGGDAGAVGSPGYIIVRY